MGNGIIQGEGRSAEEFRASSPLRNVNHANQEPQSHTQQSVPAQKDERVAKAATGSSRTLVMLASVTSGVAVGRGIAALESKARVGSPAMKIAGIAIAGIGVSKIVDSHASTSVRVGGALQVAGGLGLAASKNPKALIISGSISLVGSILASGDNK